MITCILAPTVTLISRPSLLDLPIEKFEFPRAGLDVTNLIAIAGKTCYDSFGGESRAATDHVRALIAHGHGSVLEHANFTFHIAGVSRNLTHELVRHRAGMAYSQRSTRFVDEGQNPQVVLEPWMAEMVRSEKAQYSPEYWAFIKAMEEAFTAYRKIVNHASEDVTLKVTRGRARQVLPGCLATEIVVTGNLRAWRHFIIARSAAGAEAEIRRLAVAIYDILSLEAPSVFEDFTGREVDGFLEFTSSSPKV